MKVYRFSTGAVMVLCTIICLLTACAQSTGGSSGPGSPALTFTGLSDNFESYTTGLWMPDGGSASGGWKKILGNWSIATDGGQAKTAQQDSSADAWMAHTSFTWTDYAFSMKVKLPLIWDETEIGIAGRISNVSAPLSADYYFLTLQQTTAVAAKVTIPSYKYLVLGCYKSSTRQVLSSKSFPFTGNTYYTLKLSFTGNTIKGYVNGSEELSYTDASPIVAGGVGFGSGPIPGAPAGTYTAGYYDDALVEAN